jgi:DNA (cytosine-5)-methyltransferase 1
VPELLRLQGFPDEYAMAGTRREVQLQVGNSVPPTLGRVVAEAIRDQLTGSAPAGVLQAQLPLPV